MKDDRGTVIICGAAPDYVNNNRVLRAHVAEGFTELLGERAVYECSFESAGAAIDHFRPVFVLCFGSCMPDSSYLQYIANKTHACGGIFGVWLHDDPYEWDFNYRATECADIIFSNDSWATTHYDHPRVMHVPLAASPNAHFRALGGRRIFDLYFCGAAFPNRVALMRALQREIENSVVVVEGVEWPSDIAWAKNSRIPQSDIVDRYAQSLAVLNVGRQHDLANSQYQLVPTTPGPRTFEAAMAGAPQLFMVESLEIQRYYDPGSEIVLCDTARDVADVLEEWATDPQRAAEVARRAQCRTLAEHCYRHRAESILQSVKSMLGRDLRAGDSLSIEGSKEEGGGPEATNRGAGMDDSKDHMRRVFH